MEHMVLELNSNMVKRLVKGQEVSVMNEGKVYLIRPKKISDAERAQLLQNQVYNLRYLLKKERQKNA
jgi:predicted HTH domain antitoxin